MNRYFLILISLCMGCATSAKTSTPRNFKVAFIGDQGFDNNSKEVLKLIAEEGAELVIHQGDFDYLDNPGLWEKNIDQYLGKDFPYIASAGNHDAKKWFDSDGYRERLNRRAQRVPGMNCTGDHGVNGVCVYKGLMVITSGIGSIGKNHFDYMEGVFNQSDSFTWKICSWHKQQKEYQVGEKGDAVPWKFYQLCRENGAIIAQGHEHSYARTHTMENFEKFKIADKGSTLKVGQGMSFAFTNGLGGASIRKQTRCKKKGDCPYWASIYTKDQGAKPGVLFCTFYVNGQEDLAQCSFKTINGKTVDEFDILNLNHNGRVSQSTGAPEILWFPTEMSTTVDVWHPHTDRSFCL